MLETMSEEELELSQIVVHEGETWTYVTRFHYKCALRTRAEDASRSSSGVAWFAAASVAAFPCHSVRVSCPSCRQETLTRIQHRASFRTQLFALVLLSLGCIPCGLKLFCPDSKDSCKDTLHFCSKCKSYLGVNKF